MHQLIKTCLLFTTLIFFLQTITAQVLAASLTVFPQVNMSQVVNDIKAGLIDTVIFNPGTYIINNKSQAFLLNQIPGSEQQPITFKAKINGTAIIDGQNIHRCLHVTNSTYVTVTGLYVKNCHYGNTSEYDSLNQQVPNPTVYATPVLIEQSEHITLSEITSYHSNDYGIDDHPFHIRASRYVVLQDSAGYGHGRKTINVDWNSRNIIVRNFFGYWQAYTSGNDWPAMFNFYGRPESLRWPGYKDGSQDRLGENIVLYIDPQVVKDVRGPTLSGLRDTLMNVVVKGNDTTNNNQQFSFSGCRMCQLKDIVSIAGNQTEGRGVLIAEHRDPFLENVVESQISNYTWIGTKSTQTIHGIHISTLQSLTSGQAFSLNVTNTFFQGNNQNNTAAWSRSGDSNGIILHSHNAFNQLLLPNLYTGNFLFWPGYQGKTPPQIMQEHQEQFIDPQWNTSQYGDGAYLIASRTNLAGKGQNGDPIGADVIYQYRTQWNANDQKVTVLTTIPLWPWPLEARICAETARANNGVNGISVTYKGPYQIQYDYDNNGIVETYTCSGGIWKTLAGVYGSTPPPSSTPTPTAPPVNLKSLLANWLTNQFDQDNNQKLNSLDWLLSLF